MALPVILEATMVLGGLGIASSSLLLWASRKFAVKEDPRVGEVLNVLPGVNCGACGFAGCRAFAEGIVANPESGAVCPVGPAGMMEKIGDMLGVELKPAADLVASPRCAGSMGLARMFGPYEGIRDCRAALTSYQGPKFCRFGCLGLDTCARVCPVGAIDVHDAIVDVDFDACIGCGLCVEICPRDILEMLPRGPRVRVACANEDKGAAARKVCEVACIACRKCVKVCPDDAIHVVDNLARIDYGKCTRCGLCVDVCPPKIIRWEEKPNEPVPAVIAEGAAGTLAP